MYHVDITNSGSSTFRARSKDGEFAIDTKGQAMTPPDVLLAGLGSCVGVYIRKYAEGAGLTIKEFDIAVDAEFCKEHPVSFKSIKIKIDLRGADLDDRRKQALLGFIKNCPVHNTLKCNPAVDMVVT